VSIEDGVPSQARFSRLLRLSLNIGTKNVRQRDGNEHPVGLERVDEDRVKAKPAGARRPVWRGLLRAQTGELAPCLAAVVGGEKGGVLDARVDHLRVLQGRF